MNDHAAYAIMLTDILGDLLEHTEDATACASGLCIRVRELIGLNSAYIWEYSRESEESRLLALSPERYRAKAESIPFGRLMLATGKKSASAWIRKGESEEGDGILAITGSERSLAVPLKAGNRAIGLLYLDGVRDEHNIEAIAATLDKLAPVIALVMRNSRHYVTLKEEVASRTEELRERNTLLAKALAEKEVLLREIHHRVKNNLQIVDSMLHLQSERVTDPALREVLANSRNRVYTMALVHEELYRSEDIANVPIREYLSRLSEFIVSESGKDISLETDLPEITLPVDLAIPCGLVANELLINAIKHAFPGTAGGTVRVSLRQADGELILAVADSGIGMAPGFDPEECDSLGMKILYALSGQLEGVLTARNENGAVFELRFPDRRAH